MKLKLKYKNGEVLIVQCYKINMIDNDIIFNTYPNNEENEIPLKVLSYIKVDDVIMYDEEFF